MSETKHLKCSVCGKEFDKEFKDGEERLAAWYDKNPDKIKCSDCYAGGAKKKSTAPKIEKATTTAKAPASTMGAIPPITAEEIRKSYDEVIAAFVDVLPEVKEFIGGWVTTIVLSRRPKKY